jgi:Ras GTPase-activating-like protein IQGAP2/3
MHDWATGIQSAARRCIALRHHAQRVQQGQWFEPTAVGLQACARGKLARNQRVRQHQLLETSTKTIVALQAACRQCLAQRTTAEVRQVVSRPKNVQTVTSIQALARARLQRQRGAAEIRALESQQTTYISLQSHIRGALVRRKHRAREQKLDDVNDTIVQIQAAARGLLARQQKRAYVAHLQQSLPVVSSLQAAARARLARQAHVSTHKALAKVEVAESVGGLQAFLRSRLAKKQTTEQKKKLGFVQPDVIGFQAVARGYLARQEYNEWREYLQDPHTQGALVFLQSLIRGFLGRRRFYVRMTHYWQHTNDLVKIQALWRGRTERQLYTRLLTGIDVDVPTIQNYMHLLDETDADYQRQIRTETLRREVVRLIRENQTLETEVKDLDTKIALILKNKMSFEDLVRAKHRAKDHTADDAGSWKDNTGRDPFTTHAHLDRTSQRKLELFEYLFFMLQTKGEYLSRLLIKLHRDDAAEGDRRLLETVTLILFGYGQEKREDYLFHKLLQVRFVSARRYVLELIPDFGARRSSPLSVA